MTMGEMIITGEKIQQLADIYIGEIDDFNFNPIIKPQTSKQKNLNTFNTPFDNPKYVFCYSSRINELSTKMHLFLNDFFLITHNSDENIEPTDNVIDILKCNKLIKWFSQNVAFEHDKLQLIPIGIANSMWQHGISAFKKINFETNKLYIKKQHVYFNFNIITNQKKRRPCFELLKNKVTWQDTISPNLYLHNLKDFQFCICPEGNGLDTHRLWECLYLKVVPIVIDSPFTKILLKNKVPLVVLKCWEDFDPLALNYSDYSFDEINHLLDFAILTNNIKFC
jgi:hypothetical protein